jgi:pre-mRNA-processing factor 19
VLGTHALEQKYNATRQELSYALYSQDAASRVVARLIRERDAARECVFKSLLFAYHHLIESPNRALANVQATLGVAQPASEDVEMAENAAGEDTLPTNIISQIDETHQVLSAARKKRKPPADYATALEVKTYVSTHTIPSLHSASPSGITSLAVSRVNPSHFLTGGNDKIVQLYDRSADKVLASLKGHSKKVNHVAFRERESDATLIISAGADKIVKIWAHDSTSGEYIPKSTIRSHKGELTGLAVHPTSTILTLCSADKTYSLHDLTSFAQVFRSIPSEEAFTSLAVHPDGTLLALGTPASTIQIFDIRTGAMAATLSPADAAPFTVNSLTFSENGYHLLAPNSLSSVAIWDLRKQKATHSISLGDDFKVNRVVYDTSAQYFGVAGSLGARIFAHKTWDELLRLDEGGEVSDLVFGEQGKEIWGASGREVRIWGLPS